MTQLTESQIRGIDFAVRVTAKSFPFIKGWEFSEYHKKDYNERYPLISIDLIIDLNEVDGVFPFKVKDYWLERAKERSLTDLLYLSSLSADYAGNFNEKEIIQADLNLNYQNMPKKIKGKQMEPIYSVGNYHYIKSISLHYYTTEPTSNEYYEIN